MNLVLNEIGALNVPQIVVLNQIDKVDIPADLVRNEYGNIVQVSISAVTGAGMDLLKQALTEHQQLLKRQSTEQSAYA